MKVLPTAIFLCTVLFALASAECDVEGEFDQAGINPDVINVSPKEFIKVEYADKSVELGNELTPTEAASDPIKIEYESNRDVFYTLLMTDPDVPSRQDPYLKEIFHWIVANIQGGDVTTGETIFKYVGPHPPTATGFHRYIILLFRQPGKLVFDEDRLTNDNSDGRKNFSTTNFSAKYNLGNPIAGNFFRAQHQD